MEKEEKELTCKFSVKGKMCKDAFYVLMVLIDDLKLRGFVFKKHERIDLPNNETQIDYVMEKY